MRNDLATDISAIKSTVAPLLLFVAMTTLLLVISVQRNDARERVRELEGQLEHDAAKIEGYRELREDICSALEAETWVAHRVLIPHDPHAGAILLDSITSIQRLCP